ELRHGMWQMVRALRKRGVTIILTTHYIEEAQDMADRIGVINRGELVVVEEKDVLMRRLGRKQLTLVLQAPMERIPDDLSALPLELSADRQSLVYTFDTQTEETGIADLLRRLAAHGIDFKDLNSSERSLEEIFVGLVHGNRPDATNQKPSPSRGGLGRYEFPPSQSETHPHPDLHLKGEGEKRAEGDKPRTGTPSAPSTASRWRAPSAP